MKDVLYDQEWLKTAPNFGVYYMYRGLAKDETDKEIISKNNLRYDITIIAPKMLGKEFPKTLGHLHAKIGGTEITYPEIYEMLEGEGDFLVQHISNGKIDDVYAVKVKKGEKIIIPPNYAHFMLNVLDIEIIMANWFEKNSQSDYSPIKEKHGACYYAIRNGDGSLKWIKNENYGDVPELKIYQASDFLNLLGKFNIAPTMPMYNLVNDLGKLDFLKHPQNYQWN